MSRNHTVPPRAAGRGSADPSRTPATGLTRRAALAGAAGAVLMAGRSRAQAPMIRIGMLQDGSGPYSYLGGATAVACARQAVDELRGGLGFEVELIVADHGNKPDNALAIARQWIDQGGVDAMLEFNNSAIGLAVSALLRDRDKVMLANGVGAAALSGASCTPNVTHWAFDTAMLAKTVGTALYDRGGDTWFYIRADYTFGRALRDDSAAVVQKAGGRVLGEVAVPLGTADYGSALLQAQASGAKVVALGLAGTDLLNCIKQAGEFGLAASGQEIAALVLFINDVHALGLPAAQGTRLTESFYWDLDDRTRAFTKRVIGNTGGIPPNMSQAASYSATRHYLKAVAAMGAGPAKASGRAAVARMKEMPIDDDVLAHARIRPDGRVVSDAYLFKVKAPAESRGAWDLYDVEATLGPDQAWRSMAEGGCPLVKT